MASVGDLFFSGFDPAALEARLRAQARFAPVEDVNGDQIAQFNGPCRANKLQVAPVAYARVAG